MNSDNIECRAGRTVWRSNGVEDEEPDPCLPPNVGVCDGDG